MRHVPALDGLRGVAVVGVLLFHTDHLQGGFLGVDLFFTLSGFLITALLLVEHEQTGRISLRAFWVRRARRLLPAMLAVVVAAAALGRHVLRADELERFGVQVVATLGYVANWAEIGRGRDYWALFASPSPLEHVWSLAIEEQFYLVWPLLVVAAYRLVPNRNAVRAVVVAGVVASVGATWWVLEGTGGISRAYYGTDTRAASILIGAGLATVVVGVDRAPSRRERALAVAAVPAALLVGASWFVTTGADEWLYRWGFVAHATATAVVIGAVVGPCAGVVGRVLANRALCRIGLVSYGLYLWHWPLYVLLDESRTGFDGWSLTALRVAASALAAGVSFVVIESPIRQQRVRLPRPAWTTVGAVTATAVLAVVFVWTPGRERPATALVSDHAATGALLRSGAGADARSQQPRRLLVVGDSGAATLADELEAAGAAAGLSVRVEGRVGCGLVGAGDGVHAPDGGFSPDAEGCGDWPRRWSQLVAEEAPDAVLVLLAWGGGGDRDLGDGVRRGPCDEAFDRHYGGQIRRAVDVLGARGATVVLATVPPEVGNAPGRARTDCVNDLYGAAATTPGVELLDLRAWTCGIGSCGDVRDDVRPDGVHFAGEGAARAAGWIVDETTRLTGLDGVPFVLFVGDSQALRLVEHAPPKEEIDLRVGSLAVLGCGLADEPVVMAGRVVEKQECAEPLAALPREIDALDPDVVAVHVGVWEALDQVHDGETVAFGDPRWRETLTRRVRASLERLGGAHQLVVLSTPCFGEGPGRESFGTADLDERIASVNAVLAEEGARVGAPLVDYAGFLCPDGEVRVEVEGTAVRPDGVHLDRDGAREVWPWLSARLSGASGGV